MSVLLISINHELSLPFSPLCSVTPTNNLAYSDLMNDSARADGLILDYY